MRAAAVLGQRCELATAARLAGIDNPLEAVDEAVRAGILVGVSVLEPLTIAFSHPLVHQAVYGHIALEGRRTLHMRAAELEGETGLAHLVAVAIRPDDDLADVLEREALDARGRGRPVMAARWLAEASKLSGKRERARPTVVRRRGGLARVRANPRCAGFGRPA